MAIYHLSVKNGSPGMGRAHADYIEREGKYQDKEDLQHSESGNMPKWAQHDSMEFWKAADLYERANGRPFKEIEIALPRELDSEQRVELVREFVKNTLGERHAYTWAIHNPEASDGLEQPHAHIMFTERVNDGIDRDPEHFFKRWNASEPEKGGAGKDRYLSSKAFVRDVRQEWAMTANQFLEREGIEVRIDHRSYIDQGIELEPQIKRGISTYTTERGILKEITRENRERSARNGERILESPEIALKVLTATQSVFSKRDIENFVFRNSDSVKQYQDVYQSIFDSEELVALKVPEHEGEFFTSRELREIEGQLIERSQRMGQSEEKGVSEQSRKESERSFNPGQKEAYDLMTSGVQLSVVNGAAGTGKSYVLGAVKEAFEKDNFNVIGAALQGKTADDMQRDAGIQSMTMHSLLSRVEKGEVNFDKKTVLVIDEAGMIGSRQMEKLLSHAEKAEAKVRLVGDAWQLHAVDAGDAFRHVSKEVPHTSSASLTEIMRQKEAWQREASTALATHDMTRGIGAYHERGFIKEFDDQEKAREGLLDQWQKDREAHPDASQIILAHTNLEREALNDRVREMKRERGELGSEKLVRTETRSLRLAEGDRLMFTRNEYNLGVKNGTLSTLEKLDGHHLHVKLDDGRQLAVNTHDYGHFDYGYALTVHKSQGVTVDRAYMMATKSMNAELAYVGMTRHKEALQVVYSREHFKDSDDLIKGLSRPENKTFSAAYEIDDRLRERERKTLAQQRENKAPNDYEIQQQRFRDRVEEAKKRTLERYQAQRGGQAVEPTHKPDHEMTLSERFQKHKDDSALRIRERLQEEQIKHIYPNLMDKAEQLGMSSEPPMSMAERFKQRMAESAERTRQKIQVRREVDAVKREALAKMQELEKIRSHPLNKEQAAHVSSLRQSMQQRGESALSIQNAEDSFRRKVYEKSPGAEGDMYFHAYMAQQALDKQVQSQEKTLEKVKVRRRRRRR
jgi:Ti-type conjugative transfer relaxase TraA